MTIISKLRPLLRPSFNRLKQIKRNAHATEVPLIEPTGFVEYLVWDKLHFFTLLGAIPLITIGGLSSILIGDAVLVDTPEGYEPEDWECEKNPVSRLLARYVYYDTTHAHEWTVGRLAKEQDSRLTKMVFEDVKVNQQKYQDYRAWYFAGWLQAREARADRLEVDRQVHYQYNHPIVEPGRVSRGPE